jgi:DNA topoisomerase-1
VGERKNSVARELVVVESPTKARTIGRILGSRFRVLASMGHLKDLPKSKLGVDIENGFQPHYITVRGKGKTLKQLKTAAKDASEVWIACDPDREGEAIAFHIARELENGGQIHRILFYEITKGAVEAALADPQEIDLKKVDAQQARRILDRLVGYKVSPFLWRTVRSGLSAGRVQTVALRLICEREEEIRSFQKTEYWSILATLSGRAGEPFEAKLIKVDGKDPEIGNRETADGIAAELRKCRYVVDEFEQKKKERRPPPPFMTSTLQQDASRRLRFTAKKTMTVAQQLYEGIELGGEGSVGLITYMRTDAVRVSGQAVEAVRKYIEGRFGPDYLPAKPRFFATKKSAQGAHEAIRPTSIGRTPESVREHLSRDQLRLYELIWERFCGSQMANAVYDTARADIDAGRYRLRATGSALAFPGFLVLRGGGEERGEREGEQRRLPPLTEGEELTLVDLACEQHFTEPPPRYTEGSLVKELESKGIGRPSTYAPIVSIIQVRRYVAKERGRFVPTELGEIVSRLLISNFPGIFDVGFTAKMEDELDRIESGDIEWVAVVKEFYDPFKRRLEVAESKSEELKNSLQEETEEICPQCGKPMVVKWGRYGKFLACSGYPECKQTQPLAEEAEGQKTDEVCAECGAPMVIKRGKFGRFLACSRYPDCRHTRPLGLGIPCGKEGCEGELVERHVKGRTFYGCSLYPKCDFATWDRPLPTPCKKCGAPFLVLKRSRTKGQIEKCPRCGAENKHG